MSGRAALCLLFVVACTSALLADCARPLQDDELSTVVLRLLRMSALPPPQLSPAHRVARNTFNMQLKSTSHVEECNLKSDSAGECSEVTPNTRSRAELEQITWQQLGKSTYSSMLHVVPAGPNPIGNEYRPGNTIHNVKKYRYPPQG